MNAMSEIVETKRHKFESGDAQPMQRERPPNATTPLEDNTKRQTKRQRKHSRTRKRNCNCRRDISSTPSPDVP